jgi:hypothetical protein
MKFVRRVAIFDLSAVRRRPFANFVNSNGVGEYKIWNNAGTPSSSPRSEPFGRGSGRASALTFFNPCRPVI